MTLEQEVLALRELVDTINAGTFNIRGTWVATVTYNINDVVYATGTTPGWYVAQEQNININPASGTVPQWLPFAFNITQVAPNFTIRNVRELPPGATPVVTNHDTTGGMDLEIFLPVGRDGTDGAQGATGLPGPAGSIAIPQFTPGSITTSTDTTTTNIETTITNTGTSTAPVWRLDITLPYRYTATTTSNPNLTASNLLPIPDNNTFMYGLLSLNLGHEFLSNSFSQRNVAGYLFTMPALTVSPSGATTTLTLNPNSVICIPTATVELIGDQITWATATFTLNVQGATVICILTVSQTSATLMSVDSLTGQWMSQAVDITQMRGGLI